MAIPVKKKVRVIEAKYSLAFQLPNVASEWDLTKNNGLTPFDVSKGSDKKIWWKCKFGHEWEAGINNRSHGRNCPYCSGKKVCKDNCLSTLNPKLASEWHPTLNGELTPKDVLNKSNKEAWWICSKCKNEWVSHISDRHNRGCPYCSKYPKVLCKDNCLSKKNPEISKDWNYQKNKLTPENVFPSNPMKVWWKCFKGHEWECSIRDRTSKGIGCPFCNGIALKDGTVCSSLIEAFYYLKFTLDGYICGIDFFHNKEYASVNPEHKDVIGKIRYDFYFPKTKEYIEVSSFSNRSLKNKYTDYLSGILLKHSYVTNILNGNFLFVMRKLNKEEMLTVKKHMED